VYPVEVEGVLLAHPDVADAGVFGVPDDDWGESIVAAVQLRPGVPADADTQARLAAFCRERLASYKCPRVWEFRGDMPRTDAGKLDKLKMRDAPAWCSGTTPRRAPAS